MTGFEPRTSGIESNCSTNWATTTSQSFYQYKKGEKSEYKEPEPDEDVDLLVDNVEWKNAEGVVLLDVAGRAELVERAFRHAGEHVDHGIDTILLWKRFKLSIRHLIRHW